MPVPTLQHFQNETKENDIHKFQYIHKQKGFFELMSFPIKEYIKLKKKKFGWEVAESCTKYAKKMHFDFF